MEDLAQEDMSKRGALGLANLGNTCFMNAVIQALRNNKEWSFFCLKDHIKPYIQEKETGSKKILLAYIDLLQSLWGGSGPGYVMPAGFYTELKAVVKDTIYADFGRRQPQDAHEFLVWLLDQMYMATQSQVSINIKDEEGLQPMILSALKGWKTAFEKQWSPLTDLVFGLYRIQYSCSECKSVYTRWETFNTLKYTLCMDNDEPKYLLDCLKNEFTEETIDEYACELCCKHDAKKRTLTKKKVHIWRLPKLLILTAKRFNPDGSKIYHPVAAVNHVKFTDLFPEDSEEPSKYIQYNLFATVDHFGFGGGGHYTAQAKSFLTNKWAHYDDNTMTNIDEPSIGRSTYMMFFTCS